MSLKVLAFVCLARFLLVMFVDLSNGSAANYTKNSLRQKYADYGTKWIFHPDGNEKPTIGYLQIPPGHSRIATTTNATNDQLEKFLNFRLYSRIVKNGANLSFTDGIVLKTLFDVKKDTKFVTHGWLSNGKSDTCLYIKDAFLLKENVNVIVFDWGEIAGNIFYPIAMGRTKMVGNYYGKFIQYLIENGADPKRMHLIGHSLGAHVSGFAGRFVKQKLGRITGLDPALPGFVRGFEVDRLLPSDADYVDVIHTCAGVLGIDESLGHADFYPNGGGPPQPGCSGVAEIIEACSHGRSWKYFAESIMGDGRKFLAAKCDSWTDYLKETCRDNRLTPMGNPTPSTARGSYYLATESSPPFASKATLLSSNSLLDDDNYLNEH